MFYLDEKCAPVGNGCDASADGVEQPADQTESKLKSILFSQNFYTI